MSQLVHRTKALEHLAEEHPCYTEQARLDHGRIHLAVAPNCNLGCR
jgi:hypothetical protein